MSTTAVVVERELVRASRRWQTYAQRGVFALLLFGFIVVYWEDQVVGRAWDAHTLGRTGRKIIEAWAWLQFVLLAVINIHRVTLALTIATTVATLPVRRR